MGRRTQQRRRKRVEELVALRHDQREFRRRWMARVEAWCRNLREGGSVERAVDAEGKPTGKAREIIQSVLQELADIGEPEGSSLAAETRIRLELACRVGSGEGTERRRDEEAA